MHRRQYLLNHIFMYYFIYLFRDRLGIGLQFSRKMKGQVRQLGVIKPQVVLPTQDLRQLGVIKPKVIETIVTNHAPDRPCVLLQAVLPKQVINYKEIKFKIL